MEQHQEEHRELIDSDTNVTSAENHQDGKNMSIQSENNSLLEKSAEIDNNSNNTDAKDIKDSQTNEKESSGKEIKENSMTKLAFVLDDEKINSSLQKELLDSRLKIQELELKLKEYEQQNIEQYIQKINVLIQKNESLQDISQRIKEESQEEINKLTVENQLLNNQCESQKQYIQEKEASGISIQSTILDLESQIKTLKEESEKYIQSYQIEKAKNSSLINSLDEANLKLTEKSTQFSILQQQYISLQNTLNTQTAVIPHNNNQQNQTNNNQMNYEYIMNEMKQLESIYNEKKTDFEKKESQWKVIENEYINKNNRLNQELVELNKKYLQQQNQFNVKLNEVTKSVNVYKVQVEEYKLKHTITNNEFTYSQYTELETKYNKIILEFRDKEANYSKTIHEQKDQIQSLTESVSKYRDQLRAMENALMTHEDSKHQSNTINIEEQFFKMCSVYEDIPIPVGIPARKGDDPELKLLLSSLTPSLKQEISSWSSNLQKKSFDTISLCHLTNIPEKLYTQICTILLPYFNTFQNYEIKAESKKQYTFTYDIQLIPIPKFSFPEASPIAINVSQPAVNTPSLNYEQTQEALPEKTKKFWKWNN
ncbi:hypothetical protein WA158_005009 [Blastocystis sp. Blastoise]